MSSVKTFEHFTDTEIIDKILAGEKQLYELLIRRNNPFLYRIGRSYNYNHQDTEDLMQETYIKAFFNLAKFEGRSSFKTWICRIMLNNCYHKKQSGVYKHESSTEEITIEKIFPMLHHHSNTENSVLTKELGSILERALERIPENYRLVFTLRELNGLSTNETSELLNLSETNVKVRLNRAKSMLRSFIESRYSPADIYEFNLAYCDSMVERVMARI
jgi:RNA polymerase sigma factor (sigma-70 family)